MSKQANDPNRQYETLIDEWVIAALLQGSCTLTELFKAIPGVYPVLVLEAVSRLVLAQKIDAQIAAKIIKTAQRATSKPADRYARPQRLPLPVPHPLDYDWRFSEAAIRKLTSLCLESTQAGDIVALLGVPSVFAMAMELTSQRTLVLIDANPAIVELLGKGYSNETILRCDLLKDPVPEVGAAAVVLDPPWYMEYFTAFFWAATRLCAMGGKVLVSLPPLGTRPGIEYERAELLTYANQLGLTLETLSPAALPYIMPPFEVNALSRANVWGIPPDWRRGDLAVFTKSQTIETARPYVMEATEPYWNEYRIGEVRIRVKPDEEKVFIDPKLVSLVEGDILLSVSRREPLRAKVDVWTSGNRVFACRGSGILQQILKAAARESSPEKEVSDWLARRLTEEERMLVQCAARQIDDIIKQEQQEYGY